jgi:hypothetical protein
MEQDQSTLICKEEFRCDDPKPFGHSRFADEPKRFRRCGDCIGCEAFNARVIAVLTQADSTLGLMEALGIGWLAAKHLRAKFKYNRTKGYLSREPRRPGPKPGVKYNGGAMKILGVCLCGLRIFEGDDHNRSSCDVRNGVLSRPILGSALGAALRLHGK